jgi:hypothetical protein
MPTTRSSGVHVVRPAHAAMRWRRPAAATVDLLA